MNVKISKYNPAKLPPDPPSLEAASSAVRHVAVTAADAGMRVDRFLAAQLPGTPYTFLHRLMRTGQVRVNSGRVQGGVRLAAGDSVRLPPVRLALPQERTHPPDSWVRGMRERIVWRDGELLVLNKAAGMAVHGGSGDSWGAVDAMRRLFQWEESPLRPELCHRLDKETSGCLLFALTAPALRQMAAAFRAGTVEKEYWALVRGHPQPAAGVIDLPLLKGTVRAGERMVVSADRGLAARTRYQVISRFAHASLVQVWLESGRTHQIRVHFQSIGHPLAGDQKYGDPAFDGQMRTMGLRRLFLHARRLAFPHPVTGEQVTVETPLDAALQQVLQNLENSATQK
ncbi:MAG: RluA family pseudouridine synthase [Magnetococcales bacterium]|nr:RluA family pseudouridine synthase [Magnetococcales bacterium]